MEPGGMNFDFESKMPFILITQRFTAFYPLPQ